MATLEDQQQIQSTATAVIAVNALARIGMKPAPALIERSMSPTDEEFEEDPDGCIELWGGICEQAYANFRPRGVPTTKKKGN